MCGRVLSYGSETGALRGFTAHRTQVSLMTSGPQLVLLGPSQWLLAMLPLSSDRLGRWHRLKRARVGSKLKRLNKLIKRGIFLVILIILL